eukprot:scaffold4059_cov174-Ochromonas_danica.AAC.2
MTCQMTMSDDDNNNNNSRPLHKLVEIDIAWEFNTPQINPSHSGWANASANQIDLFAEEVNGELKCHLIGLEPRLDSPPMLLTLTNRHFFVMRAKYDGQSEMARLLLQSGAHSSPREQTVIKNAYWSAQQRMIAIDGSPSVNTTSTTTTTTTPTTSSNLSYGMENAVDDNPYTIYQSVANRNVHITFDLGSFRWITRFRILVSGDENSPKRVILYRSITRGVGPFEKVALFTLQPRQYSYSIMENITQDHDYFNRTSNTYEITEQSFSGFSGFGRYWKILFLDNYGGQSIAIREIYLDGYNEQVTVVPFSLDRSGRYAMYYLPISTYLQVSTTTAVSKGSNSTRGVDPVQTVFAETFAIDYIHLIRAPEVYKVRGCLDRYGDNPLTLNQSPQYNVTSYLEMINDHLPLSWYSKNNLSLSYANTYNCPWEGGAIISIEGINFGTSPIVTIDSQSCPILSLRNSSEDGRRKEILCRLPPLITSNSNTVKRVRVESGLHPQLFYDLSALTYRRAPPVPARPIVANLASYKVDLIWSPPGDVFDMMTVTGYKIIYFPAAYPHFVSNLTVGNVTMTSVRGLHPNTEYVFAIAAVAEDLFAATLPTDLYGRRDLLPNAMIGEFSTFTNVTATLPYDFTFNFFNANQTLNNSGVSHDEVLILDGPTGQYGSEGAYGLILVGSANVENCNVSSTCCDGYNASIGVASCGNYKSVCSVLPARMLAFNSVIDGITRRVVPSNLEASNGAPPEIFISTLEELSANKGAKLPNIACGPALRLTPSEARQSGSAWYRRKMNVHEGFDTIIRFRISNPSQKCDRLDDVNTYCRSRGADGWSFVLQNQAPDALGLAGSGLGYEGDDDANLVMSITNADFAYGGEGDWGVGFGLLYVYLDDLYSPVITTPLNLGATLNLDDGRSYVGLTSATGDNHWQAHDILSWTFSSLYIDEDYTAPLQDMITRRVGWMPHKCAITSVDINCLQKLWHNYKNNQNNSQYINRAIKWSYTHHGRGAYSLHVFVKLTAHLIQRNSNSNGISTER